MFDFVFRMFATGDAALPARGMGTLAQQIASRLPAASVQTAMPVGAVQKNAVCITDGREVRARAVVVACDAPGAARLLGEERLPAGQGVTCLYFAADVPPIREPILVLNGDDVGPINNLCVPSQVAPAYAPPGKSLVSATVLGTQPDDAGALEAAVREQLDAWFGSASRDWRHLRTYSIPYALPAQIPPALSPVAKPVRRDDGIFVCGDYLDTASIQGAMLSGRRAADEVLHSRSQGA
jgi:phytoene dehydrogenase-like protein